MKNLLKSAFLSSTLISAANANPYEVAENSDALVIITEWSEFKELDLRKIKSLMRNPLIIDGRNMYSPEKLKKEGFMYISIGRMDVI